MASLAKDGSGWRILFVCPRTSKRHTVRTGRCAKKNAETARNMVEKLVEARRLGGSIDGQTAEWLKAIDDTLRGRLAKVGLIDRQGPVSLGAFIESYIQERKGRGNVGPATLVVWGHAQRNLEAFFGPEKDMRTVTAADADAWAAWLRTNEELSENTTRKRSQSAKMFFAVALKRKLLAENPFSGLVGTVVSVPERQFFITREMTNALTEQCHGPEYRLLLAMARYMGVRVPSEIVPLTWADVDWQNMRIVITSPKTKRHKGGAKRVCPIFPEVVPALREAWEAAPEGATSIFPSIRSATKNLRTWLERAIVRAGLTPWPRLWQNFRATRATELADQFPSHVAAAWLGHTERIADQHYRQVTSTHYEQAIRQPTGALPARAEKPAQNPAQYPHRSDRTELEGESRNPGKTGAHDVIPIGTTCSNGRRGTRTPDIVRVRHAL